MKPRPADVDGETTCEHSPKTQTMDMRRNAARKQTEGTQDETEMDGGRMEMKDKHRTGIL